MTGIEWVKNPDNQTQGITVNSKTGCLNHTPEGLCLGGLFPCYAWKLARTRLKQRYLANEPDYTGYNARILSDPFYPRFWPERLEEVRKIKKPTGIFLDDMSDWMGDYWPEEWTRQEIQAMRDCPQHRFYTLTKQPQRLPEFSPFPCWVGVTATNAKMADDAGYYLQKIDAPIRFLSLEPLLEPMQLFFSPLVFNRLDWLVIGACTGTRDAIFRLCNLSDGNSKLTPMQWANIWTAQPRIEWVREIVNAADKAGISVFLKNNLEPLLVTQKNNNKYAPLWANGGYGTLRQEMPNGT